MASMPSVSPGHPGDDPVDGSQLSEKFNDGEDDDEDSFSSVEESAESTGNQQDMAVHELQNEAASIDAAALDLQLSK